MLKTPPDNMSLTIDYERRRILFTQQGLLDKNSVLTSYRRVFSAEGFDPSYDTVVDYQKVTEVNLGPQDFREILREVRETETRTGRGVLIVGSDIGRLILAKLFCELSAVLSRKKIRWKPFQTASDAEKWLQLSA